MRKNFLFFAFCCLFVISGCSDQGISFKGKVFYAHYEWVNVAPPGYAEFQMEQLLVIDGPLEDACVKEIEHSEAVETNSDGEYSLKISVPRKLGYPTADKYTLQAWGPWNVNLGDEKISHYISARPGDDVAVRNFILCQHTVEGTGE